MHQLLVYIVGGELTMRDSKNNVENNVFAFSEHWLTRYYQQALWQQHPLLFLLMVYYAQQQHWSDQQWLQCRQQSLQSLLAAIELPITEANYRTLMRTIETDEFDQLLNHDLPALTKLYQFFKNHSASLLAEATLPQKIMHLLQHASVSEVSAPPLS
jgi:hypothetical protein